MASIVCISGLATEFTKVKDNLNERDLRERQNLKKANRTLTSSKYKVPRPDLSRLGTSEIAGGYFASYAMSKHLAFVYVYYASRGPTTCSGSVLTSSLILCAAHCFDGDNGRFDVTGVYVRVGQYNNRGKWHKAYYVDVHNSYDYRTFQNDVAIIWIEKIRSPFSAVYIPRPFYRLKTRSILYAAGFGRTSENGPSSNRVRETKLRYQNYYACRRGTSYSVYRYWSISRILCATDPRFPSAGGADTCRGDSGGPLYLKSSSTRMFQQGITSFGTKCGIKGSIGWYTNLKTYTPMIIAYSKKIYKNWYEVYDYED